MSQPYAAVHPLFTRQLVDDAFIEMSSLIMRQHVVGEIVVFGQAGIMLQFTEVTTTDKVDVRIDAAHAAVQQAAQTVAAHRGWLASWLSEQATASLPERQSLKVYGAYPSREQLGLRVYVARPECLLAGKLYTCRDTDRADAVLLANHLKIKTPTGLSDLFRSFYPRHQPEPHRDARRAAFMMRIIETL
jgi:hypothetical protein